MPKIRKQYQKGFTTLDNTPLNDESLSWKAKGLFAYLWSKPDDWDYRLTEVARHATDGIGSTSTGVNELEQAGYLKRKQKNKNGVFGDSVWTLSEQPIFKNPLTENPSSDNALTEEPYTENRKLLNTDLLNTNITNKRTSKNKDDDDRTRAHGQNSAEKTFSLLNEYQLRQFKQGGHLTKLLSMVDELGDDLVAWAIQQTVDSASSPNWNYFARVIQRIQENNVHSVEEAVNLSKQHSEKLKHRGKVPRQPMKSKPDDVPDWLKQGQNMTPEERAEWQAKALQEELAKGDNAQWL